MPKKKIKTNNNNTVTIIMVTTLTIPLDNVADDINWHSPNALSQTPNYETAIQD